MKWYRSLLFLFFFNNSLVQESKLQRSRWLIDYLFELALKADTNRTELLFLQSEMQKSESSISKSANSIKPAQQSGNIEAKKIVLQAKQTNNNLILINHE